MTRAADDGRRTSPLSIRTTAQHKAIADRIAREERRSVTQIIEMLLEAEAERKGWMLAPPATPKRKASR